MYGRVLFFLLKNITKLWGSFVQIYEKAKQPSSFERSYILIKTEFVLTIDDEVDLIVEGNLFQIWVVGVEPSKMHRYCKVKEEAMLVSSDSVDSYVVTSVLDEDRHVIACPEINARDAIDDDDIFVRAWKREGFQGEEMVDESKDLSGARSMDEMTCFVVCENEGNAPKSVAYRLRDGGTENWLVTKTKHLEVKWE
ncbi:hypothetical protein V6N11_058677 [Hibiscus sabdariffa]|uniref:Uncharacterized protein n=1 Tax=Hibiscus sabdariffa TaxID=183260 RepID=A0ABR2U533_9ROSI